MHRQAVLSNFVKVLRIYSLDVFYRGRCFILLALLSLSSLLQCCYLIQNRLHAFIDQCSEIRIHKTSE